MHQWYIYTHIWKYIYIYISPKREDPKKFRLDCVWTGGPDWTRAALDWTGSGLGWTGLVLDWTGLELDWAGLDWTVTGLDWTWEDWECNDRAGLDLEPTGDIWSHLYVVMGDPCRWGYMVMGCEWGKPAHVRHDRGCTCMWFVMHLYKQVTDDM